MKTAIRRPYLVGAITLLSAFALLVGSGFLNADDKKPEKPADAKTEDKKPDDKPGEKWQALFDGKTLDGWKDSEFGAGGEITVEKGAMQFSYGDGCVGVTYQKEFPKVDYEVHVQAQRVDGNDFFCGMTFPVQDSPCSFVVGGWGGSVVGLSAVDGMLANENDTTKFETFKKGQWYDIRLRVTKSRITAWIDDKPYVDLETAGRKFTIHPAVTKSKPFGICAWSTTAAIRKIELRKLTPAEANSNKPAEEPKKQ